MDAKLEHIIESSNSPSSTRQCAEQCLARGFTLEDTVAFLRATEEVNPELDEEVALRRMHAIEAKYPREYGSKDGD